MKSLPFYIAERESWAVSHLLSAESCTEEGSWRSYSLARLHCGASTVITGISILFQSAVCLLLLPVRATALLAGGGSDELSLSREVVNLSDSSNQRLIALAERLGIALIGVIFPGELKATHSARTESNVLQAIVDEQKKRFIDDFEKALALIDETVEKYKLAKIYLIEGDATSGTFYDRYKELTRAKIDAFFDEIELEWGEIKGQKSQIREEWLIEILRRIERKMIELKSCQPPIQSITCVDWVAVLVDEQKGQLQKRIDSAFAAAQAECLDPNSDNMVAQQVSEQKKESLQARYRELREKISVHCDPIKKLVEDAHSLFERGIVQIQEVYRQIDDLNKSPASELVAARREELCQQALSIQNKFEAETIAILRKMQSCEVKFSSLVESSMSSEQLQEYFQTAQERKNRRSWWPFFSS